MEISKIEQIERKITSRNTIHVIYEAKGSRHFCFGSSRGQFDWIYMKYQVREGEKEGEWGRERPSVIPLVGRKQSSSEGDHKIFFNLFPFCFKLSKKS